jgi:hypothetical protein
MKIRSKAKDCLRNILFLCGITLDNKYNFICAECMSDPIHDNYKKCRNEYNKIDSLAHFYCIMNYYKSQDIQPPLEFQHTLIIFKKLLQLTKQHDKLPKIITELKLEVQINQAGELNIDEATYRFRVKMLQILAHF